MKKEGIELIKNGKRIDGRGFEDIRKPFRIKLGVLKNANGSAYVEWGKNKIVAGVFGPREVLPRHLENPHKAIIKCQYSMSTFSSLEEHGRAGPNRRSIELSKVIREALENIVLLEHYPRTMIEVFITVLQAEGGTRVASFTAAVGALIDAGIPMRTIAGGIAVGKVDGTMVVDLGKEEDNYGEADVPMVFTKEGDILLLQMDGMLTKDEVEYALTKGYEKVKDIILPELRKAVEEKYAGEIVKKLEL